MTAIRRLTNELTNLKEAGYSWLQEVSLESGNMFHWMVTISPENFPYNQALYRLEVVFRQLYPFVPPKVVFVTPIYHPNVDIQGILYLPCITAENWKPRTTPAEILESIIDLINKPYLLHPLRKDVADEYQSDTRRFMKNALEHAKKHGYRPAHDSFDSLKN